MRADLDIPALKRRLEQRLADLEAGHGTPTEAGGAVGLDPARIGRMRAGPAAGLCIGCAGADE